MAARSELPGMGTHLPPQPTTFIGREKERMLVRMLLQRADVRLLTLTGPGGIGKSRLALQVAAELMSDFHGGVILVELAAIHDPALLIPTIAQACGLVVTGDIPLHRRLMDMLHDRQCLLLLDNAEQLLGAAGQLAELLMAAPAVKMLVTSRAPLRLAWEQRIPVPPLTIPLRHAAIALPQARQYDALLFLERSAQRVRPDFALTADNLPVLIEICRRLDGLPLAIELAATRLHLFSPQTLLTQLDDRLALLTNGPRDRPTRQQTLRATLDWSYQLLNQYERRLFARLAVFVDGCAIAEAAAICAEDSRPDSGIGAGLIALAEQSMLQPLTTPTGDTRFMMLETIREYALEQLDSLGEQLHIHRRHLTVYTELAERAAEAFEGPTQAQWLERIAHEHGNLRAALTWALEQQDSASALRLALALRLFWFMRGYLTEGRERLIEILGLPIALPRDRARALDCAGFLARYQGDYRMAAVYIQESLGIWRRLADAHGIADALSNLGYVALSTGDYPAARASYAESLATYRALDNRQGCADCLNHLGTISYFLNDFGAAQTLHREALELWDYLGDSEGVAYAHYHLGDVFLAQRLPVIAAEHYAASLRIAAELNWPIGLVGAIEGAASLAADAHPDPALRLAAFAAHIREQVAIPLADNRRLVLTRRLQPAYQALDDTTRIEAQQAGKTLTHAEAIALASAELNAHAQLSMPSPPPMPATAGLTPRERAVVYQIAQGQANRAIATTLVISEKTVEAHISRVLAKLGFTSRAQIAAWAVAAGIAPGPASPLIDDQP